MRGLVTCKDLRVRLFSLNCYLFGAFQAVLTASWPPLDPRINNKSGRPHQRKFPSARPIFRLCWAPPTCSYGPADWRFSDHAAGLDQSAGQSVLHIVSTKQRSGLGANRPVHDAVGQAARKRKGNRPNSESGKLTCDLLNAHMLSWLPDCSAKLTRAARPLPAARPSEQACWRRPSRPE